MPVNPSLLKKLSEAWLSAGLDDTIATRLLDAVDHAAKVGAACRALADVTESPAARLARGDITVDQAIVENLIPQDQRRTQAAELASKTRELILSEAIKELRGMGDALIVEHLAPALAEVIAEAAELAPEVLDVEDDQDAIRQPKNIRDAWVRMTELAQRRRDLTTARNALLRDPVKALRRPTVETPMDAYHYGKPELLVALRRETKGRPPAAVLALEVLAGTEPRLATAAELDDQYARKSRPTPEPEPLDAA